MAERFDGLGQDYTGWASMANATSQDQMKLLACNVAEPLLEQLKSINAAMGGSLRARDMLNFTAVRLMSLAHESADEKLQLAAMKELRCVAATVAEIEELERQREEDAAARHNLPADTTAAVGPFGHVRGGFPEPVPSWEQPPAKKRRAAKEAGPQA